MAQEMTEFVDVLPMTSLKTCLAVVKGEPVTKAAAVLALVNLTSYVGGQFVPLDVVTTQNAPMTKGEAAEYLTAMMDLGATIQKIGDGKLLDLAKLLLPLLLKFLI